MLDSETSPTPSLKKAASSVKRSPVWLGPYFKKKRPSRHNQATTFDAEKCLLAFERGWKRQLVYRAIVDEMKGKHRADIYYTTPDGKRLRSKVEIEDYLLRKGIADLTMDNFSFAKEPVGGTEEQETIRHATKLGLMAGIPATSEVKMGRSCAEPNLPSPKKIKISRISNMPKVSEDISLRKILPKSSAKVPVSSVSPDLAVSSSQVKTYARPSVSTQAVFSQTIPTSYSKSLQKPAVPKHHVMYTTKLCESEGPPTRILTPMLSDKARQQAFHCTGLCPLGENTVPSLQCLKCLCLFHAKCTKMPSPVVDIITTGGAKFLCPNCYKEQREKLASRVYTAPFSHEPLTVDPSSSSESDSDDDVAYAGDMDYPASYTRVNLHPSVIPTPPTSPKEVDLFDRTDKQNQQNSQAKYIQGSSLQSSIANYQALGFVNPAEGLQTNASPEMILQSILPNASQPSTSSNNLLGIPGGQILQIQAPGTNSPRYILVRPTQSNVNVPGGISMQSPRALYFPTMAGQIPLMLPPTVLPPAQPIRSYAPSVQPQLQNISNTQAQLYNSCGYSFPQHKSIPSTGFPLPSTQVQKKASSSSQPKVFFYFASKFKY
ncbi:hypothetical protein SK128_013095 [Halocaridina rubra]|uniref:MBD domain-containing protein n=1 Tax=Halocaridina rubra TaxID=373956 RepID=A0AAN8XJB1_HALRR